MRYRSNRGYGSSNFSFRRFAGVGLIVMGLLPFLRIQLAPEYLIALPLIFAGFTLMSAFGRTNLGVIVFSMWLIILGAMTILRAQAWFNIVIPSYDEIMLIVAMLSGLLLLVDR